MSSDKLQNLRILVAEDNEVTRMLLSAHIRNHGAIAEFAADGAQAIEMAEKNRYDCIVLDIHMPKVDGLSALGRIREFNRDTPIVAVTADPSENTADRIIASGFDACLAKPVDQDTLLELLSNLGRTDIAQQSKPPSSAQGATDYTTYDKDVAIALAGGNEELAREMFTILIRTLTTDKAQLDDTTLTSDELLEVAHRVHGAAEYCGTGKLRRQAASMEKALKEQAPPKTVEILRTRLVQSITELLELPNPYD